MLFFSTLFYSYAILLHLLFYSSSCSTPVLHFIPFIFYSNHIPLFLTVLDCSYIHATLFNSILTYFILFICYSTLFYLLWCTLLNATVLHFVVFYYILRESIQLYSYSTILWTLRYSTLFSSYSCSTLFDATPFCSIHILHDYISLCCSLAHFINTLLYPTPLYSTLFYSQSTLL